MVTRAMSTIAWTTPPSVICRTETARLEPSRSKRLTAGTFLARLVSEHISTTRLVKFTEVGRAQVAVTRARTSTWTRREAGLRNSRWTVSVALATAELSAQFGKFAIR